MNQLYAEHEDNTLGGQNKTEKDPGSLDDLSAPNCLPVLPTHPLTDIKVIKNLKQKFYLFELLCFGISLFQQFRLFPI